MIQILLLEDDVLMGDTIIDLLEEDQYCVEHVKNGEDFLVLSYEKSYDIYLLDINVPRINGKEGLEEVRKRGDTTPAIFLTSYKDKENLYACFKSGCDDYLTKPFDGDELLLRIEALLKRSGKATKPIEYDTLVYDPKTLTIRCRDEVIQLGFKGVELFKLFYEYRGAIVTKEKIVERLWGYDEPHSEGAIRVYVAKLQKYLSEKKIHSIKGIGYKIDY